METILVIILLIVLILIPLPSSGPTVHHRKDQDGFH